MFIQLFLIFFSNCPKPYIWAQKNTAAAGGVAGKTMISVMVLDFFD